MRLQSSKAARSVKTGEHIREISLDQASLTAQLEIDCFPPRFRFRFRVYDLSIELIGNSVVRQYDWTVL